MSRLRIGHLTTSYHTAFILMGTDWIQKRMGVTPDWVLFPTGPEMMKAFSRHELDLGYVGLPPAMIAISKGLPIKCIAGGHMEGTVLTAKKEMKTLEEIGDIEKTLGQLRGKTIGTPSRGSIHDVITRKMLDDARLQQSVHVRNYDWADLVFQAMEEDEVQAAAGTPPLAVLTSQRLNARIMISPKKMWPNNPSYGIVTTADIIDNSAETLESFLKLHEDACNLIRGEPNKAAAIVSEAVRLMDKEFVFQVYKVSPKYCSSLPSEYIRSTMEFVPVLQRMGYITRDLHESEVFYRTLIERVHTEPSHYEDPLALV